jgi:hypothetical protein
MWNYLWGVSRLYLRPHGSVVINRKVAGSIPDEAIGFLKMYLILPAALWP